jgi:RimJ/RimL family protein N-acetyltransferase
MQVTRFRDPESFLQHTEPFLLASETENNLMLGLRDLGQAFDEDAYLAAVTDEDRVVGCAFRTPPYKAVITRTSRSAVRYLVRDLSDRYPDLAEVLGPEPTVTEFAELWARRTRIPSTQGMRQRLFEIRHGPQIATLARGRLRTAEERDLPTVIGWTAAFIAEALPGEPTDPEKHAIRRIATRSLSLWEDGKPVSMAGWAGRTARGVRVNFVYTPAEHRGRGYATACVARLTQQLFDEGRTFCCLYTDVGNPTSNSIYQKIGYRPVCDLSTYILNSRKAGKGR